MKKRKVSAGKIVNRKARFDYDLGDTLLLGIELTGKETKALRQGRGQLVGAHVVVAKGELWLVNATISSGKTFNIPENEATRTRKLLATKREIAALIAAKQQGQSIIPTDILTKGRFIKVKIAIGKGKKRYDKRQTIQKREQDREAHRAMKRR